MITTILEIYDKWGNVEVKFDHYYKYRFYFSGHSENGDRVLASFGGCSDDIYRTEVNAEDKYVLGEVDWMWDSIDVYEAVTGNLIAEWNDF